MTSTCFPMKLSGKGKVMVFLSAVNTVTQKTINLLPSRSVEVGHIIPIPSYTHHMLHTHPGSSFYESDQKKIFRKH